MVKPCATQVPASDSIGAADDRAILDDIGRQPSMSLSAGHSMASSGEVLQTASINAARRAWMSGSVAADAVQKFAAVMTGRRSASRRRAT